MFKKKAVVHISIKFRGEEDGEEMYYVVESEKAANVITDWFPKNVKIQKTDGFGQPGDFMIFVNNILVHTKLGLAHGFLSTCAPEQKGAVKKAVQDAIDGKEPQGVEQQVAEAQMKSDEEKRQKAEEEFAAQKKARQEKKKKEGRSSGAQKFWSGRSSGMVEDAEDLLLQSEELKRRKVEAVQKKLDQAGKQWQEKEEEATRKEAEEEENRPKEEEGRSLAEETEEERKAKEEAEAIRRKKGEEEALELEAMALKLEANERKLLNEAAKRKAEQNIGFSACCRPVGGDDAIGELYPTYVS